MAVRTLSNSEISTALTCWAQWDFQYGGHLAGSTLRHKIVPAILSRGAAWGAAMQSYHSGESPELVRFHVRNSLMADQIKAEKHGVLLPERMLDEQEAEVMALVGHYAMRNPERYQGLQRIEQHLKVPIPARVASEPRSGFGRHKSRAGYSNKYAFEGYLDWSAIDPLPLLTGEWIIETKLRGELHQMSVLERSTQLRWYAWAYWQTTGRMPAGVIVDTWLAIVPNPPRMVQGRKKDSGMVLSTAKDQVTTPELYLAACLQCDVEPDKDLLTALRERVWGSRAIIAFTPDELERAGRELVSAGQLIRDLDSGVLLPIRHAIPRNCNGCRFKRICTNPNDKFAIDAEFVRGTPKRLLPPRKEEHVPS